MKLAVHNAANIVPCMTDAEFAELKADIAKHGQRDPLVLFDGKILDGRNRYRACTELDIDPSTITLDLHDVGGDPIAYVISTNVHRRHLSASQRSMLALEVERLYAAEAKERQVRKPANSVPAPVPEQKGEAREKAAKALGVGPRSVQAAKSVIKSGCAELQQAVREGKVTVKVAEKFARAVPSPVAQAAIVNGAVLEDDPNKIIRQHASKRQVVASDKIPAARITGAQQALKDLEQRLDRLGVLPSLQNHINAIREGIDNVQR